jgi:riboflavin kinase/FMN adenylyltransferase
MQTVVSRAKAVNAVPTAITFDPHPRSVLYPENTPPLLQTLDQRLAAFEVLGIEQAIVIRFNKDFAAQDAETFLRESSMSVFRREKFISAKASRSGKIAAAISSFYEN